MVDRRQLELPTADDDQHSAFELLAGYKNILGRVDLPRFSRHGFRESV